MEWFFATKTGRTVSLCIIVAVSTLASWWAFSSHYEKVGRDKCQGEYAKAQGEADRQQAGQNAANNVTSSELAKDTQAEGRKASSEIAAQQRKDEEKVNDAYRKPKPTAPIAPGSCVHPVDQRVQDTIAEAARRANAP